jgi:hypothetical protein
MNAADHEEYDDATMIRLGPPANANHVQQQSEYQVSEAVANAKPLPDVYRENGDKHTVAWALAGRCNEYIDARRMLHAYQCQRSAIAKLQTPSSFPHEQAACHISSLPYELIRSILLYNETCDIFNFSITCKHYCGAMRQDLTSSRPESSFKRCINILALLHGVPDHLTASTFVSEFNLALCLLRYIHHNDVHKFGFALERRPAIDAITHSHRIAGSTPYIEVANIPLDQGYPRHDCISPTGSIALYVSWLNVRLLERQSDNSFAIIAEARLPPEWGDAGFGYWCPQNGFTMAMTKFRSGRGISSIVVTVRPQRFFSANLGQCVRV